MFTLVRSVCLNSPPESGGARGGLKWRLFHPPGLLSLSDYKINTFLKLTSSKFILPLPY